MSTSKYGNGNGKNNLGIRYNPSLVVKKDSGGGGGIVEPNCPHCSNINKYKKNGELLPINHWLRVSTDPASELICPVLKTTECRYCFQLGHTISKCGVLEKLKKQEMAVALKEEKKVLYENRKKNVGEVGVGGGGSGRNVFALLDDDNDVITTGLHLMPSKNKNVRFSGISKKKTIEEDEDTKKKMKHDEDFPVLMGSVVSNKKTMTVQKKSNTPLLYSKVVVAPQPVSVSSKLGDGVGNIGNSSPNSIVWSGRSSVSPPLTKILEDNDLFPSSQYIPETTIPKFVWGTGKYMSWNSPDTSDDEDDDYNDEVQRRRKIQDTMDDDDDDLENYVPDSYKSGCSSTRCW